MKRLSLISISVFLLALVSINVSLSQEKKVHKVSGANLFADEFEKFSEGFQATNKSCKPVMFGSTTGKGIAQFLNGEAVLVMASRAMNSKEKEQAAAKGIQVSERPVGKTSLAVVINAQNSISELSSEQLRKIFSGEITNWKDVGGADEPIRVTIRAVPETGAGVLFQRVILKGASYAPNSQVMGTYGTTLRVAGKSPAIGYVPTCSGFFKKLITSGVKEMKVKLDKDSPAINAPAGLVKETTFPLCIPLVLIWNEKALDPCMLDFVNYIDKTIAAAGSEKAKSSGRTAAVAHVGLR
jgi:phosphate transport system substrate-binding protein